MPAAGEAAPSLAEAVELLERAIGYTRGTLQQVSADRLQNPTPCRGWRLLDLLRHMDDSLAAFLEAAELETLDLAPCAGSAAADAVVERLRTRACALLGSWSRNPPGVVSIGGLPVPSSVVVATSVLEIAVHGWDVSAGCGSARPLPAALAEELWNLRTLVVSDDDRPWRFAAPVPVAAGQGPSERLLGFLGRRP